MEYKIGIAIIVFVIVILQLVARDNPGFLGGFFGEAPSGRKTVEDDLAEGDADCGDADCGEAGGFDIGGLF